MCYPKPITQISRDNWKVRDEKKLNYKTADRITGLTRLQLEIENGAGGKTQ